MRRALFTLALFTALAAPVAAQKSGTGPTPVPEPKPRIVAVSALVTGSGLRVTWAPVAGTRRACVLRHSGAELLNCTSAPPLWLLPQDEGRIVSPGERIELRVYDAGLVVVAQGAATARWVHYLPATRR